MVQLIWVVVGYGGDGWWWWDVVDLVFVLFIFLI